MITLALLVVGLVALAAVGLIVWVLAGMKQTMRRTITEIATVAGGALLVVAFAAYWAFYAIPAHGAECGKASFYAEQHQGRTMANGKPFNMYALTAASWSYPLGTRVSVMNAANGQKVVVTITDRGPAHRLHRVIDLSKAAFVKLARPEVGVIKKVCIVAF